MARLQQHRLRIGLLTIFLALGSGPAGQTAGQETGQPPRPGGGAPPSDDAFKYGSPPVLPEGMTQEQMWPAATAKGWAKPCLIPWQRTFDDAVKVAKATGAPILVCVNMDGEIASEHFAGVRYRDPATAKALEPYVCVVASVYRHTPRDYDELGQRVICPRFGTVTCGEHIANEVELYAKYFEGKRISPRHIMLDLEGRKTYDVYYSWDTATVFTAFAKGVENLPPPKRLVRDGLSVEQLAGSPDNADRVTVERGYKQGGREERVSILRAVGTHPGVDHDDVLRLAVFGLDLECARVAREVLAQSESESSIDVIAEALKVPLEPAEREALLAAAERLGEKYPRARMLASLHQGLSMSSSRFREDDDLRTGPSIVEAAAEAYERSELVERAPEDPSAKLLLAESLFACANDASRDATWRSLALGDALASAEEAAKLGLSGWRLDATLAAILGQLGEEERAREHAVQAVDGGMGTAESSAAGPSELIQMRVLALFAEGRQLAIRKAYSEKVKWPPEWLAEINTAYSKLAARDLVAEESLISYYDFLAWIGGARRAGEVLESALAKFPDSPALHGRLRSRILWDKGASELESEYARRLEAPGASSQLSWFAGYASLVAAEHFRRRGELDRALEAYGRGIALYERCIAGLPESRDNGDHYIALAHAGRARVLLERGELESATNEMLAAFARRAASTGTMDGLDITPGMTALMLQARLTEADRADLAATLKAAMDGMDPALFAEPDFARQSQRTRGGSSGR